MRADRWPQPGRGGGWSLVGGDRTDLGGLTAAEAQALFVLVGPAASIATEARSALRKLVRALPVPFRAEADAAARAVVIDPTRWGEPGRARPASKATIGSTPSEPICSTRLTGIKKHVVVLEGAGLVTTAKVGRVRHCRLGPRRLEEEPAWITRHQQLLEARFDRLGEYLERTKGSQP